MEFAPAILRRRVTAMASAHQAARPTAWGWIAAMWLAGGLFDATQTVFAMSSDAQHPAGLLIFFTELATWLPWALATPFVIRVARRHPIRGMSVHTICMHLAVF